MINIFLKEKEQYKLKIFQFILFSSASQTPSNIAIHFNIKPFTLRRYIRELKDDIFFLFKDQVIFQENINHSLTIKIDPNLTVDFIITTLRIYYAQKSSLYHLLRAIISKPYSSVTHISHDINMSEIAIYKLLSQLKPILTNFGIEFSFESGANFIGDELGVRYFLFLIYWNLFHTLSNSPFTKNLPSEFTDLFFLKTALNIKKELASSQSTKLLIMSGITSYRLVYFKKRATVKEDFLKDIQFFYDNSPCLNLSSFNVPINIIENESKIFSFLVRGLISDFDSYDKKESIVKKYSTSNLEISRSISLILSEFKVQFKFEYSDSNFVESYYLLLITYIHIKYLYFDVDNFIYNPIKDNIEDVKLNPQYNIVKKQLISFLRLLPFSHPVTSDDSEKITSLLYIIYELNAKTSPLLIYVINTSNIANTILIKRTLRSIFSKDIVQFSDSPSSADIIISDAFENQEEKNNFYFNNITNKRTWASLVNFISNAITIKKSFD